MTRGFPEAEFAARVARAQAMMARHGLAALLLTTEPEVRYFTGYITRFWESPTRPWFVVLPASGKPIAVIPAIGAPVMARTWVEDIRTWRAPDLEDDGVSLLADTLRDVAGDGPVGVPMGHETHLRMPLEDYERLGASVRLVPDYGIMRALRMVKSEAEIDKIRTACAVAGRAFDRVGDIAAPGVPLSQVFRRFQMLCLEEGADWVPYLAGGAGPLGYDDVISPASDAPLEKGDVLMLDTCANLRGYFCDFDRNFAIAWADEAAMRAHERLWQATEAGLAQARPGVTCAELFATMAGSLGTGTSAVGRFGHGLGMQMTEWPSIAAWDQTVLEEGMVITLEPSIEVAPGKVMVHEEDILITDGPPRLLTERAPKTLPVIGG